MLSMIQTKVYLSEGSSRVWVRLNGYVSGFSYGTISAAEPLDRRADGTAPKIKGNVEFTESAMIVALVEGDAGQALAKALCHPDHDGAGEVKIEYPQGRTAIVPGLFLAATDNVVDGEQFQGFTIQFLQDGMEEVF